MRVLHRAVASSVPLSTAHVTFSRAFKNSLLRVHTGVASSAHHCALAFTAITLMTFWLLERGIELGTLAATWQGASKGPSSTSGPDEQLDAGQKIVGFAQAHADVIPHAFIAAVLQVRPEP